MAGTITRLRYERTRRSNDVRRLMGHLADPIGNPDRPEWRTPDGLPSWWPFWSDCLRRNVQELVRIARALAKEEGVDL